MTGYKKSNILGHKWQPANGYIGWSIQAFGEAERSKAEGESTQSTGSVPVEGKFK